MCIQWDTTSIIVADTEFDFEEWKTTCTENLILVGGPVSNIIVRKLVSGGFSAVDWATSPGEWEYILKPYSTCDVLIVAGKNRDATREAAFKLMDQL
jgi:S-layer protein (TIGR01564 family)